MNDAFSLAAPAGVTRTESGWGDHFIGRAEDLIATGLITADQLPGQPGRNKYSCTFYCGVPVKRGANNDRNEHYLSIKRVGQKFEVLKGVSDRIYEQRRAALDAQLEIDAKARAAEQIQEQASKMTPADFRAFCLRRFGQARALDGCDGLYPFRFPDDIRATIEALCSQIQELMQSAPVLPLCTRNDGPGKGHLRLAWSAQ